MNETRTYNRVYQMTDPTGVLNMTYTYSATQTDGISGEQV
jgi:hypothetical protein